MMRSTARRPFMLTLLLLAIAPALAACQTDSAGTPMAQAAPADVPQPITRQQAALHCWMSIEKGRKDMPIDRRADVVTKCIDDKLKTAQPAPKA